MIIFIIAAPRSHRKHFPSLLLDKLATRTHTLTRSVDDAHTRSAAGLAAGRFVAVEALDAAGLGDESAAFERFGVIEVEGFVFE